MPENGWRHDHFGVIASLEYFQVRATGQGGLDRNPNFAGLEWLRRQFFHPEVFFAVKNCCFHVTPVLQDNPEQGNQKLRPQLQKMFDVEVIAAGDFSAVRRVVHLRAAKKNDYRADFNFCDSMSGDRKSTRL